VRDDTVQLTQNMTFRFDLGRLAPTRTTRRALRPASNPTQRARRAGGPQDRALYTCGCGFAFTAAVSTSVGCPHCGAGQAW
jgi:hypothetical protein